MMIGGVVSINGEGEDVASEGSWQKNLLLAKQYINLDNSMSDASGTDEVFELFGIDNTSHRCSGYLKAMEDGFYVACPDDKPLWWLVLRWLKMMLLKIVRTYHGKPFLLVVAPLLIGLCIGYLIGRQSQQRSSWLSQILERPRDWISLAHFQLREFLGEKSTPTKKYAIRSVERSNSIGALQASPRELTSREADKLLERREELVRKNLQSETGTRRESGVDVVKVPKHVAVIMDGNRRYGKAKYGSAVKGHWDGSSKLVEFAKWCIAEKVAILTVYAFSTENWNRDAGEVASLMSIFAKYCDELRIEALERNIKISVLSTDFARIPLRIQAGVKRMVDDTQHCNGLQMNICMSYGSRAELVDVSRSIAGDIFEGKLEMESIDEDEFAKRLLTHHCGDPDVLIRTSGELRMSNFLLWQLAYTEMFFVKKPWPAMEKEDLLDVIQAFAKGRKRRFGK